MFHSFITSVQASQKNKKNNSDRHQINVSKEASLLNQVRTLIENMPSSQICAQAALNIGLSANLLDFNKLLKKIESETSINSIAFTLTQLKALYKEALKLKKIAKKEIEMPLSPDKKSKRFYQAMKSNGQSLKVSVQQKKENGFQQKLVSALKGQISFRIKVKNFYSTQKLQKKDSHIKRIVQKAKNMNRRVQKVFKTFKQKQKTQIQHFKMQDDSYDQKETKVSREPKIRRRKMVTNFACDSIIAKDFSDIEQSQITQKRYNTAETGRRGYHRKQVDQFENKENQMRFYEMRRKQLKTRQRKRQIQLEREETAISKLIKKHQRLNLIQSEHQKKMITKGSFKSKTLRRQSLNNQSPQKPASKDEKPDLQAQIKNRCEEKAFKKELILQQKVNRIRQELKAKEQRITKHRINVQKEHQNTFEFTEEYLRNCSQKIKIVKYENEVKHELTIRNRFQHGLQKERQQKMLQNIAKMNQKELKKQLEKLKGKEHFQSHKYINAP